MSREAVTQQKLVDMQAEVIRLVDEKKTWQAEKEQLEKKLEESDEKLRTLQSEMEAAEKEFEVFREENTKETKELETQLNLWIEKYQVLDKVSDGCQATIKSLRGRTDAMQKELAEKDATIQEHLDCRDEAIWEKSNLQRELENTSPTFKMLRQENEALRDECKIQISIVAELEKKLTTVSNQFTGAMTSIQVFGTALGTSQAKDQKKTIDGIQHYQAAYINLQHENKKLMEEVFKLKLEKEKSIADAVEETKAMMNKQFEELHVQEAHKREEGVKCQVEQYHQDMKKAFLESQIEMAKFSHELSKFEKVMDGMAEHENVLNGQLSKLNENLAQSAEMNRPGVIDWTGADSPKYQSSEHAPDNDYYEDYCSDHYPDYQGVDQEFQSGSKKQKGNYGSDEYSRSGKKYKGGRRYGDYYKRDAKPSDQ
ncbi:unnamed protein product [Caenorhabditis sp. 36 PRJEB53466]|nr:unnamed protein product [Caenorhabditis sp. 36 PRJEB53466]